MPIEEQLLPHKELARFYKKVSWLYVCRTFDKKPLKDREALRTHDRFGISSWPQMFLFDPRDDRALASPPRNLKGFVRTFDDVLRKWKPPTAKHLKAGRAIAAELGALRKLLAVRDEKKAEKIFLKLMLEKDAFEGWLEAREIVRETLHWTNPHGPDDLDNPDPRVRSLRLEELARGLPDDRVMGMDKTRALELLLDAEQDIVVRVRALRLLREVAPSEIIASVPAFLKIANDQFRYEVLGLVKDHPKPAHTPLILDLIEGVGKKYPARNPNVVRIRALECLGRCGDESALGPMIDLLGGPLNNSLTRLTPRSLAAIGKRLDPLRPRITKALLTALPAPVIEAGSKQGAFQQRLSTAMAREIANAIGLLVGKPAPGVGRGWSADDRRQLEESLKTLLE